MELTLDPYVGVGPVKLGMSVSEVRQLLGRPRTFRKTSDSETPTDDFSEHGLHVHYDASGRVEAIELMEPANPLFNGVEILGRPFSEVLRIFLRLDPQAEVDGSGLTSASIGIGVYAPSSSKNPGAAVQGVIIFRRGYYG